MNSKADTQYDVIIAGAGPAGISTAINLCRLDPSIKDRLIVLEKNNRPGKKPCGGGISPDTDIWLKDLGIDISPFALTLNQMRIIFAQDEYTEHAVVKPAMMRTVLREELDRAMIDKARDLGISIVQEEQIASFHCDNNRVIVQTHNNTFTAKIIVGTDGAQSVIRKNLYDQSGNKSSENLCSTLSTLVQTDKKDYPEQLKTEALIDLSCTLQNGIFGYAWSFPFIIKGESWLNIGIGSFRTVKTPSLKTIFNQFIDRHNITTDQSSWSSHPIRWFHPSSIFSDNRVLLAGDAAGVDPLTGEGISFSLGYGNIAAGTIHYALKRNDFSFSSYREDILNHNVGKTLAARLILADNLFENHLHEDIKTLLSSFIRC